MTQTVEIGPPIKRREQSPERKHSVGIFLGADSWDEVVSALYRIARYMEEKGPGRTLTSGGYSSGYTVIDVVNPDMTHDKYFEDLKLWLDKHKESR